MMFLNWQHNEWCQSCRFDNTRLGTGQQVRSMKVWYRGMLRFHCQSIEGRGFARVDFFLTDKQDVYINEVNSLPGFTGISMFPWLWQQGGLSSSQLIDNLIKGIRPNG